MESFRRVFKVNPSQGQLKIVDSLIERIARTIDMIKNLASYAQLKLVIWKKIVWTRIILQNTKTFFSDVPEWAEDGSDEMGSFDGGAFVSNRVSIDVVYFGIRIYVYIFSHSCLSLKITACLFS